MTNSTTPNTEADIAKQEAKWLNDLYLDALLKEDDWKERRHDY